MMRMLILSALTAAVFFTACAPSQKAVKKEAEPAAATPKAYDESFDPLSLKDDDIKIEQKETTESKPEAKQKNKTEQEIPAAGLQEVEGFRVQLLATRNLETATIEQERAENQFKSKGYNVYLTFETPFYKLRIGDLLNRKQAEELRDLAKSYGYDQAFIVRSKVQVTREQLENNF